MTEGALQSGSSISASKREYLDKYYGGKAAHLSNDELADRLELDVCIAVGSAEQEFCCGDENMHAEYGFLVEAARRLRLTQKSLG